MIETYSVFFGAIQMVKYSHQLTTVTYGLNCASLLFECFIDDETDRFPKAISLLSKGRYIDIFGGTESVEEAKEIIII